VVCIERRREVRLLFGAATGTFARGLLGDSFSVKVDARGEGGEEEQAEVAAVMASPSDVRDVLVDPLENRAVSFNGSKRKRSGDKLVEAVLSLLDLERLDSLSVGFDACVSTGEAGDAGRTASCL
jgi:hypothetical protein